MKAKFLLSKKVVRDKISFLEDLGIKVIYSYKTNHEVGDVIQEECENVDFSIHAFEEIDMIKDKKKISFFTQAELESNLKGLLKKGIRNFVVDNEVDLERLLKVIPAKRVNELLLSLKDNLNIGRLGVHIHRKSQNTSEWEIKEEIEDSLSKEALERLDMLNLGGGLPTKYRSYTANVMKYIVEKLKVAKEFLDTYKIETIIEPGRFIAAPSVKLFAEVIQVYEGNVILNTTIYNCCLDTIIGQHKLLVEEELLEGEGEYYLIKGNSPTRDDIFRYKVKLNNPKVGDIITFLNAGAYNYTTDFFGYKKLETEIVEDF
jgi:ornithine decarboxylase